MMVDIIMLTGDSRRLTANFTNLNSGLPSDPDIVKFIIYTDKYAKIEEVVLGVANKFSTGEYYYDYIASDVKQTIYFEWNGDFSGTPSIDRGRIKTAFII